MSDIMQSNIAKFITLIFIHTANSMQKHSFLMDNSKPENDIVDFMSAKGYLPNDKNLPQLSIMKNTKDDVSYILSKLTDEELINLLNVEPKKNIYDLSDIVSIALQGKTAIKEKKNISSLVKQNDYDMGILANVGNKKLRIPTISNTQTAFHKLNHKEIFSQNQKNSASYLAIKTLHNLLHNRPRQLLEDETLNDEKKELLFDILVAQLKALCCKSTFKKQHSQIHNEILSANILEKKTLKHRDKPQLDSTDRNNNEFIFLILNDEIKSKDNEDLVLVNPDTLETNSSVLILGPITPPLTDDQLKTVMNRISRELEKPEYASLLQQLSDGTLSNSNISVMKNLIYGPETRRYIKAHRCNHQSKLAKVYGGPKWLICTGYLNINTPSLYD